MNWLDLIKAFPEIVTMVIALVKDFEVPGFGSEKKQAVLDVLKAGLDALATCGVKVPITVILTVASFVIDAVVAGYNILGIFKKDAKAETA